MEFIAHIKAQEVTSFAKQTLEEHLRGTSKLAAGFAAKFHNSSWGEVLGLWHDLGKYSQAFQRYIGSVIRFVAGIDSIAQAAGRCNRNGKRPSGTVSIINPKNESIDSLHDIKTGRDISNRIINELESQGAGLPDDLIHPKVMEPYFQYYFYNRASEMDYKVDIGRSDTLLNLLSKNSVSVSEYTRIHGKSPQMYFQQAFATAGEQFKAIDAPTQGIVVPYSGAGKKLVAELFSQFAVEQQYKLLKKAQKFTVNAFPNVIKKLVEQKAIREVPEIGVLVLTDPRFYHPAFGLNSEIKTDYETLISD